MAKRLILSAVYTVIWTEQSKRQTKQKEALMPQDNLISIIIPPEDIYRQWQFMNRIYKAGTNGGSPEKDLQM